jgi:hypothetical protein
MRVLDARVNGMPRQVSTKYGEKCVLDVATTEGQYQVWRPAGDSEVMGRRNGERVTIALDSKGKASLVEHASNSPAVGLATTKPEIKRIGIQPAVAVPFEAETQLKKQMGFQTELEPQPNRSAEIADYIQRLGKLYGHCLTAAKTIPATGILEAPEIKDIATTIFIQTVRHFDI